MGSTFSWDWYWMEYIWMKSRNRIARKKERESGGMENCIVCMCVCLSVFQIACNFPSFSLCASFNAPLTTLCVCVVRWQQVLFFCYRTQIMAGNNNNNGICITNRYCLITIRCIFFFLLVSFRCRRTKMMSLENIIIGISCLVSAFHFSHKIRFILLSTNEIIGHSNCCT